jgi:hypothetical protein
VHLFGFAGDVDQDTFVKIVRQGVAARVANGNDYGITRTFFSTLSAMSREDYNLILEESFPTWFVRSFRRLPATEGAFREKLAKKLTETGSWASEFDITIVKHILKELKKKLVIFNDRPPKSSYAFDKARNTLYLLNKHEVHYNAIIPQVTKKGDAQSKSSKSPCAQHKLRNPNTGRCVSKTSCKGWEIRAKQLEGARNV